MIRFAKQILKNRGLVHAANSSAKVSSFAFADRYAVSPMIFDDDYVPFLIDYCRQNDISTIIPLFDIDLEVLSKSKKLFQDNDMDVIVSNNDVVKMCNDKWKTYNYLKDHNIRCPKTYISIAEVRKDLQAGVLRFPVIMKPRIGMGSIGVVKANNEDEMNVYTEIIESEINRTYLHFLRRKDMNVLFQEYIDGQEYGLDVMNGLDNHFIISVVKQKFQMRAGETDSARIVQDKQLFDLGKTISDKLKHTGNLDIDVIRVDNKDFVIEMNCRFGGGYPFSHMAGANLLGYLLDERKLEKNWFKDIKYGLEIYKDMDMVCIE